LSCGESKCAAGTDFFIDDALHGATTPFNGTVGAHLSGPVVTVDPMGLLSIPGQVCRISSPVGPASSAL
jgi:hypothetical protein